MKKLILVTLCLTCALGLTGCGFDRISRQNAGEAKDSIYKYMDPNLPESAKAALKAQADAWVIYEDSKR